MLNSSTLRQIWLIIERTQTRILLELSDGELIRRLQEQLEAQRSIRCGFFVFGLIKQEISSIQVRLALRATPPAIAPLTPAIKKYLTKPEV